MTPNKELDGRHPVASHETPVAVASFLTRQSVESNAMRVSSYRHKTISFL